MAAEIALAVKNTTRACELAQQAIPANTTDYRDDLWLAGIEESAGRLAEARVRLHKAVEHGRNIPDTWAALAQFVARTESPAKADEILQKARQKLPPERVPLALGRCYEAMGQWDRAEEQYQALLSAHGDDLSAHHTLADFYLRTDQQHKAEPHLRCLINSGSLAPIEQATWARRQLALVLSAGNEPDQFAEALQLINANMSSDGGTTSDARVRAFVLGTQTGRRREAIRYLEESLRRQPLTLDEQCRLAQLYELGGERGKAREQFIALVAVEKPKLPHIALFTRFLAKQGDLKEAVRWLARLEQLDANGQATIETKAFVLERQKSRDK